MSFGFVSRIKGDLDIIYMLMFKAIFIILYMLMSALMCLASWINRVPIIFGCYLSFVHHHNVLCEMVDYPVQL